MKPILMLSLVLVITLAAGCSTNLRYHKARLPLIPTKAIDRSDICGELEKSEIRCTDPKVSTKIDDFLSLVKNSLPDAYFDSGSAPGSQRSLKARVEVTALPSKRGGTKAPPILFSTLTREGQQAIIQHLAKRSDNLDDDVKALEMLLSTLRNEVSQPASPDPFDPYRKTSLTVSASLNSSSPADRLERVYTFILITEGIRVVDIEDLQTERPKVELGTLKTKEEIAASLGITGIPVSQVGGKAGVELSPTFSQTLERVIRKEFARRNIAINADQDILFIRQEGIEGIDLSGNVSTTLTLQHIERPATITAFSSVQSDSAGKISRETLTKKYYAFQNVGDIKGIVVWVVQVRSVLDGEETIMEEDDLVVPQVSHGYSTITLWRNPAILYFLEVAYQSGDNKCKGALLRYQEESIFPPRLVAFRELDHAHKFLESVVRRYSAMSRHSQGQKESIELAKNFRVGFTVDPDGKDARELNIWWLDKDEKPVDIKKLYVYRTEPKDFPLQIQTARILPADYCK